ncbi:YwaF family protein [Mycoplasmopsis fermentans]|uniref:YwaF family protein n=2 Tax=Mycoplasmopsis fermentans TaxID=2115 RepID=UPI0001E32FD0|nr:YwaF family protein [Mycoplasmopsis fermentans]ADN68790.1 hypothetical membrane spanning protein [Mycoplasmopsis fermentans JER]
MDTMSKFYLKFNTEFANGRPEAFSAFHLTFLATFLILGIILCVALRNRKEWTVKLTIGLLFFIIVFMELLKQMLWAGKAVKNTAGEYKWKWDYHQNLYPVVICSLPLYFVPLYLFLRKKTKFKEIITDFLAYITIYGGAFIMIFWPGDVFHEVILISIHTMMYHGCMLAIGMILVVNNWAKYKKGMFIVNSFVIFTILWSLAVIGNEIVYQTAKNNLEWFPNYLPDFFLMSHRQEISFVKMFENILHINGSKNYYVATLLYLIFNFVLGYAIHGIFWFIGWITRVCENKYKKSKAFKTELNMLIELKK